MTLNLLNKKGIGSIKKFGDNQKFVIAKRTQDYRIFLGTIADSEFASHNSIEIIYVIKGKIKVQVRNHTRILNKGDVYIINSNNAHCLYREEEDNILLCLQMFPEYLEKKLEIEGDYFFSNDIKMKDNIEYGLGLLYIESLSIKSKSDVEKRGINILLDSIRHNLVSNKSMNAIDIDYNSEYIVYDILEKYSDILPNEDITLSKVALEYNISYSYLSRIFKEIIGINFTRYFSKQKLNKVIDLLLNTNKTITDISIDSGFTDIKTLNRNFRDTFFMSPTQFRYKYEYERDKENKKWIQHNKEVQQFIKKIEIETNNRDNIRDMEDYIYNLDIETDAKMRNNTWNHVIDLNCIVDSSINGLNYSFKNIDIQNVIIKFKFKEGKFLLVTKNGDLRELLNFEINKLVMDLEDNNIIPIIQVDFISLNKEEFYKGKDKFYETYYLDIKNSLDFISMIIGNSKLAKSKFELYIPELNKLITQNQTSEIVFNHITGFINMLQKRFGEEFSNWGIYIGQLEIIKWKQDIRYIKELQKLPYKSGFYRLDLSYHHKDLLCQTKFSCLANNINNIIEQITRDLNIDSNNITNKLIVQFNYIVDNIKYEEEYNMLYYNIYLNILMLNIIQNPFYVTSFKGIDTGPGSEIDYFSFYNKFGIKSRFYYIYNFISKFKPDVILNENGCFVTRGGNDLVILLYSGYRECYEYTKNNVKLHPKKTKKNITLNISGLKGKYKISEYKINHNTNTFCERFLDNIGIKAMTEEEQSYVQSRSMPELKVNVLDINKLLRYSTELELLDISLIIMKSV